MSAADDYPAVAILADAAEGREKLLEAVRMFHEIERLRQWKAEAMQVLGDWDDVWKTAGRPGPLGTSKAVAVAATITALQIEIETLILRRDEIMRLSGAALQRTCVPDEANEVQ